MITIIDYDAGNLKSISNMLQYLGVASQISNQPEIISKASKLILPGVGHFDYGIRRLRESGLIDVLNQRVIMERIPILGICLGAQLMTSRSDEGDELGLGWIDGETKRFDRSKLTANLRVPHMGWADTEFNQNHPLFNGFNATPRFYYVHSFHIVCNQVENELCHAVHGYRFVSGICHNHILGVQFHPEKSHRYGKELLRNFASFNCPTSSTT